MSPLRATIRTQSDWWEITLLDLSIVADGESKAAMLGQLKHSIVSEFHLALRYGQTPFANLCRTCPTPHSEVVCINLPREVDRAMSSALAKNG